MPCCVCRAEASLLAFAGCTCGSSKLLGTRTFVLLHHVASNKASFLAISRHLKSLFIYMLFYVHHQSGVVLIFERPSPSSIHGQLTSRQFSKAQSFAFVGNHGSCTWHHDERCDRSKVGNLRSRTAYMSTSQLVTIDIRTSPLKHSRYSFPWVAASLSWVS